VVSAVLEHGRPVTGARRAAVLLRDSETMRSAGISGGQWNSDDGTELVALTRLLAQAGSGGDAIFVRGPDGSLGGWSCAVVPLVGSNERLGAVALLFDTPQPFDIVQRNFLGNVADRIAAALERSVVFARERVARVEAQAAADRFRSLQQFAGDLSGSVTRRHIADLLLRRLQLSQRASVGFVAAYESDQRHMEVLSRLGATVLPDRWTVESTFLDELRGEPLIVHDAAEITRRLPDPEIELPGVDAIALFPLGQRDPVGIVVLGWPATEAYRAAGAGAALADVALAAAALRRAEHFDVEHDIAQTLQRHLLTIPPTNIDGLRWAVRYQAGSAGLAGGDWYDVIALDGGAVLLVIGDVVGKGVQAAASVSQLRSACRALARQIDDPLELMLALDEFAVAVDEGVYSSLGLFRLDVATGRLDQVLAGHPPPAIVHPSGEAQLLPASQGAVLGISSARARASVELPAGTLLVLYTDGLVERRGELLDVGFERLTRLLSGMEAPFDPQWSCDWLVGELASDAPTADDTAVLAVVRDPP
jgi:GAF domain-containing protein